MKLRFVGALLLGCLLVSYASARWQMKWNDEFEGSTLDGSKWDIEVNCWGGGNGEKQCYTSRPQNVYVSGGSLNLRPVAGTYQGSNAGCTLNNENSCTWTQPSTSGRVRTLKAVDGSWKYGRFETRAKLPKGQWLWPAIWMLPTDNVYGTWAASGEIDIMEARGQNPTEVSSAIHYGGQWPNNRFRTSGDINFPGVDFSADFHIFALEWDVRSLRFFVDDRMIWQQSLTESFGSIYSGNGKPFDQKFHILLNVAVAGGFFDPNRYGTFNIGTASPSWTQPMQIDYVRVYEWVDGPAPTSPPTNPPTNPPVAPPTTTNPPTSGNSCELQMPLFPAADTYSDALRPSLSFAGDQILQIRKSSAFTQGRTTYLKFYLPIGSARPKRASLNLFGSLEADSASATATASVAGPISNDWTEATLTHKNLPDEGASCASSSSSSLHTGSAWRSWDVLRQVNCALQSGSTVVSFAVTLDANGHASFYSNNAPSNRPTLNLIY